MDPIKQSLYQAIRDDNIEQIRTILDNNNTESVNHANEVLNGSGLFWLTSAGYYPLHWAACDGNVAAFRELLACGADPEVQNSGGYTPFQTAKYWLRDNVHKLRQIQDLLVNWLNNNFANNLRSQKRQNIGFENNDNLNISPIERGVASVLGGELGGIGIFAYKGSGHIIEEGVRILNTVCATDNNNDEHEATQQSSMVPQSAG